MIYCFFSDDLLNSKQPAATDTFRREGTFLQISTRFRHNHAATFRSFGGCHPMGTEYSFFLPYSQRMTLYPVWRTAGTQAEITSILRINTLTQSLTD